MVAGWGATDPRDGGGPPDDGEPEETPVRGLVLRLQKLQAERSEAFQLLDEGHRAYLNSAPHYDFPRYRQLVHEVTEAFASISQEVLEIQDQLRGSQGRPDLAQHLTLLQDKERERLELTAAMQLARQRAREELGAEVLQGEERELKNRIIKTMEAISEILQDLKYDSEETE
ncbi:required for excision 1-B domain-containing protein isoform X1 [Ornithorhynchus anatinus]|uniref:required for excision 1-B domain-containing protein isoform X1 n=1 Tax=Ornithorhynchus anatinus TaxID=9258 RepID=UPI0010A8FD16|nr:required for excision 1-B domain-containing protein isoform X1 [Ornithorhynchus anatinus]